MSGKLPINIDDLLRQRTVEGDRIEYKAGWNPDAINRRIGDFLKELDLTEGCCTGIPTIWAAMAENGSPPPRFSTDDQRTHFLVELPVHPQMPGVGQVHDEAHDGAHDEAHDTVLNETESRLLTPLAEGELSRAEMAEVLGRKSRRSGHLTKAVDRLRKLGLAELTILDKPQCKNQKMRITPNGLAWLAAHPGSKEGAT